MKSTPTSSASTAFVDEVADDLRVRKGLAVGIGGDVAEGVEAEFDVLHGA